MEKVCHFENAVRFDFQVLAFLHDQISLLIALREVHVVGVFSHDPLSKFAGFDDEASGVRASDGGFKGATPVVYTMSAGLKYGLILNDRIIPLLITVEVSTKYLTTRFPFTSTMNLRLLSEGRSGLSWLSLV